jgi:hypothetical protein
MKTIAKLAAAAAIALAAASGTATAAPPAAAAAAAAEQPWATVGYVLGGQLVGGAQLFCDGATTSWGNTTTYDTAVYSYHFMCP